MSQIRGHYAIFILRDVSPLEILGLVSACCIARVLEADGLGIWVEHPGWGKSFLPRAETASILIRWDNLESLVVFPGAPLSDLELGCLIDSDELDAQPIGFEKPKRESSSDGRRQEQRNSTATRRDP